MRNPFSALALLAISVSAFGQHLVVTAEGHHDAAPADVTKDDVSAEVDRHSARVEDWIPLRGDQAGLSFTS